MFIIFKTYVMRIKELEKREGIKYVAVFKNHGKDAGTSIMHSHSQIVAYNLVPTAIQREEDVLRAYARANSCCAFCKILNVEKTSYRHVYENSSFVSFTPYASRVPYELWFFPKRHVLSVKELSDSEIKDLCEMLKRALLKLKAMDASYNMYLHNGSGDEKHFHFHVEILPRTTTWAGFELGTGTYILTISPEDAAEYYRS
jgi:UDPglucose--hexose-1-phosphate uridylyltransferase